MRIGKHSRGVWEDTSDLREGTGGDRQSHDEKNGLCNETGRDRRNIAQPKVEKKERKKTASMRIARFIRKIYNLHSKKKDR